MKKNFYLNYISAVLYGEPSEKVWLYIHNSKGSKEDAERFYDIVKEDGWQVLAIDLPERGERKDSKEKMNPWTVSPELTFVLSYARDHWKKISLRADGLGAYFALVSFQERKFDKVLFVSPIVDMAEHIDGMMEANDVNQETLKAGNIIEISDQLTLSWDYFLYAHDYPIRIWDVPTAMLCSTIETTFNQKVLEAFAERFDCELTFAEDCSYWFREADEEEILNSWIREHIKED